MWPTTDDKNELIFTLRRPNYQLGQDTAKIGTYKAFLGVFLDFFIFLIFLSDSWE